MKLLFKQRMFSWFDSYDVYNEESEVLYIVKGELAWGHLLRVYDENGNEVGMLKEKVFTFLPKFEIYKGNQCIGSIKKEFTLLKPRFNIDFNGWQIKGDWFEWDYQILDSNSRLVATISKELWNWTDTYTIDVVNEKDAVYALMIVLAIDAEKCSRNNN